MGWLWPLAPGTVSSESGTKTTCVTHSNTACQLPPAAPVSMSHLICWTGPVGTTLCQPPPPPSPPPRAHRHSSSLPAARSCVRTFVFTLHRFSLFTHKLPRMFSAMLSSQTKGKESLGFSLDWFPSRRRVF